ncbi:hypothetical protein UFOVP1623_14 [uncultured Caudovirales phage]|uniref:Uncharacterized protein n=1 Tax=uncultured Caudovirales phage TaxID=2100421 RepID=A0A6J5S405_9CAUD|nr:hypothetical protein UFOVP1376_49 [uncultured Caudovirales phage]CAB4220671.1 hypothetical protein UFOVP1623_14 [uncultured Caudovirales phage]
MRIGQFICESIGMAALIASTVIIIWFFGHIVMGVPT